MYVQGGNHGTESNIILPPLSRWASCSRRNSMMAGQIRERQAVISRTRMAARDSVKLDERAKSFGPDCYKYFLIRNVIWVAR